MGIFDSNKREREELEIIHDLVEIVKELLEDRRPKAHGVILLLTTKINNVNYIIMNTTLTLGINATSGLVLLDAVTGQPVTSASFSSNSVSSPDSGVATFAMDATNPNQIDATPVAVGTGTLSITSTVSYNDSTGAPQTKTLSNSFAFSVIAEADGVTLSITDFENVTPTKK